MAIGRIPEPGTGIPESILDAKGDLISASAADTPARLAVGTNDQRLVAASGETTGLKWVADTQNTVVDAKGDLIVGTASDTVARLAVGTNGYTLVADSAQTSGVKWAVDPVADVVTTAGDLLYATAADTVTRLGIGTAGQVLTVNSGATAPQWATAATPTADFKGFSAYMNSAGTPSAGVNTKIPFSAENFDTEGWYDHTTNYRFTPTTAGYYKIDVMVMANSTGRCRINLYKNGSEITRCFDFQPAASLQGTYSAPFYSNGTDYWEVYIFQAATSGAYQTGLDLSVFSATFLGE